VGTSVIPKEIESDPATKRMKLEEDLVNTQKTGARAAPGEKEEVTYLMVIYGNVHR
jgi:hypothetical protein